jgi:predicted NUDIX family phosphoesterase
LRRKIKMLAQHDEKILVIRREILFATGDFQGFLAMTNFDSYQRLITQHHKFLWRSAMEKDPSYKQIIPYLIFTYENKYFVMQRKPDARETRLKNKYSLGIGGHIRQEDMQGQCLSEWAQREFEEEVAYKGNLKILPLGLINDDSNAVGQVHVGYVFLLQGNSSNIAIKDEHKAGSMMTCDEIRSLYNNMEPWSQMVFDFLTSNVTMKMKQPEVMGF